MFTRYVRHHGDQTVVDSPLSRGKVVMRTTTVGEPTNQIRQLLQGMCGRRPERGGCLTNHHITNRSGPSNIDTLSIKANRTHMKSIISKCTLNGNLISLNKTRRAHSTADFRIVGQKVNGKWRDVIANGNTVQ